MRAADLHSPFRGVRVPGLPPAELLERCKAYAARLSDGQCFSHDTAAELWGIPRPGPPASGPTLHVASVGGTRPRLRGVIGHELSGSHLRVAMRHGLPVCDPVTTWLQLAGSYSLRWLVAAADHLVLSPLVPDPSDPRPHARLDVFAKRVRVFHGRHAERAHEAVDLVREGVESPQETFLRLDLLDYGLPEPLVNHEIRDATGRMIAVGDLVYPAYRILVEYDGEQHRTDSWQYRRDIERHDELAEAGWTRIRVGKDTPRLGPRSAPVRTRLALRRAGYRP